MVMLTRDHPMYNKMLVTPYRSLGVPSSLHPTIRRVLLVTQRRKKMLKTQVEPESVLTFGVDDRGFISSKENRRKTPTRGANTSFVE